MNEKGERVRLVVGAMTGTSIDGLDVALVEVVGSGLGLRARMVRGRTAGLGALGERLRAMAEQKPMGAGEMARLGWELGALHTRVIGELLEEAGGDGVGLVCAHGQTVYHEPPVSWQLLDAEAMARGLGRAVVFDLRGADLAMGGQGAPITPMADWALLRCEAEARSVVNLGGFCNVTVLPTGNEGDRSAWVRAVRGFDVCVCNQVIDEAARRGLGRGIDGGGAAALRGRAHGEATGELGLALAVQHGARRSLGTGDEGAAWAAKWSGRMCGEDLARSACEAVGRVIGEALGKSGGRRWLLAGGGTRNAALVGAIRRAAGEIPVEMTDDHGVPAEYREAICMAVLGALCEDGVSITIPGVTGRGEGECVAGRWVRSVRGAAPAGHGAEAGGRGSLAATGREGEISHDRGGLGTERRNARSMRLDRLGALECVRLINEEEATVAAVVGRAAEAIARFVEDVEARMRAAKVAGCGGGGGRLVYIGAGTSGRLGVLDASECPPTFQTPEGMVVGIIAGGDAALRRSSEGREDEREGAWAELDRLGIGAFDSVLGIAAGGTTAYVLGALERAAELGALTGLLTCAAVESPRCVRHHILLETGAEVVTGSTRMKAGTVTKMALNAISTTLMVRLGKVYENLMVDLRASNAKLRDRAARIVAELCSATREEAIGLLGAAGGSVKAAVVMRRARVSLEEAERRLEEAGGSLRAALER